MIVFKRRLLFWLVKAYLKRWGKAILFFFLLGLVVFFLLRSTVTLLVAQFLAGNRQTIGLVGSYTIDTIPSNIIADISNGLTSVSEDGTVIPKVASSWVISDNGKTYTFSLRHNVHFTDGTLLTSREIQPSFADATISRPDLYTIIFHLKDTYAPFLITASHPILKNGFVGVGDYKIQNIKLNGSFIESITLVAKNKTQDFKIYQFYPTNDALKVALALGEISIADNLIDEEFKNTTFSHFPNMNVKKKVLYNQVVTVFYNTQDKVLSDKKLRDGLSYSLPNIFADGERAYSPISPKLWAYAVASPHTQDLSHAKLLLGASIGSSAPPTLTLDTLPKYEKVAEKVAQAWSTIGIKTKIETVDSAPQVFQIYLGEYSIPLDPDQYSLWHSYQQNNITNYRSVRIDKLLEDGRKTTDRQDTVRIYTDFQKYLLDDQPATFLFYPYAYTISRK